MRRIMPVLIFLVAMLFCVSPAKAQQGPPSATLTWDAVTVPTPANLTYKVQRATMLAGPYTQVSNPSATTYTDTAVTRGTTYFYRLLSSCPGTGAGCGTTSAPILGDSVPSASVSAAIPNAATTAPVPQNLTITVQ